MFRTRRAIAMILLAHMVFSATFSPVFASGGLALTRAEEEKVGDEAFKEITKRFPFVEDAYVDQYLKSVAARLAQHMGELQFPIHVRVIKDPSVNAFAIPGGRIFLTSAILGALGDEEEMAGVMAHEMGHVEGRHIALRIEKSNGMQYAALGVMLAAVLLGASKGPDAAIAVSAFGLGALETQMLEYSRADESDADRRAQLAMEKAGYSSWGLVRFMEELRRRSVLPEQYPTYLLTHPLPELRADKLASEAGAAETKRLDPSQGYFWILQARALVADPKPWAMDLLRQRAEDHPKAFSAQLGAALYARAQGLYPVAITYLDRADRLAAANPDDAAEATHERAMLELRTGKSAEGLARLESLRGRKSPPILRDLAWAEIETDHGEAALSVCEDLAALDPDWSELPYFKGMALGKLGKGGEAHSELGRYYRDRNPELAIRHYKQALETLPKGDERSKIEDELKHLTERKKE